MNDDERFASLETNIAHILATVSDMRADLKGMAATYISATSKEPSWLIITPMAMGVTMLARLPQKLNIAPLTPIAFAGETSPTMHQPRLPTPLAKKATDITRMTSVIDWV